MINRSKYLILAVVIIIIVGIISAALIFIDDSKENDGITHEYYFSFEQGLQGWKKNGTDLDNPPINWSVERSDNISTNGDFSIELYLENFNDAGKIWMEKYFEVMPDSIYQVNISYKFATSDFGDFNLFNIITTVLGDDYKSREDLNYEGDTGHHSDAKGFVWLDKEFDYIVETDDSGKIYINIGVWGSWETTRVYYIDEVNISFQKLESINEYPDISGVWNLKHFNFEGNLTGEENVTLIQNNGKVKIEFSEGLPSPSVQGNIIKNSKNTYTDQAEFLIKGCDIRGIGVDYIYIFNESYMITETPLCETCNPSVFTI